MNGGRTLLTRRSEATFFLFHKTGLNRDDRDSRFSAGPYRPLGGSWRKNDSMVLSSATFASDAGENGAVFASRDVMAGSQDSCCSSHARWSLAWGKACRNDAGSPMAPVSAAHRMGSTRALTAPATPGSRYCWAAKESARKA